MILQELNQLFLVKKREKLNDLAIEMTLNVISH